MRIDFLPAVEIPDYFVYAMLCQDEDGPLYIKFGKTTKLYQRLSNLRTASPIPAQYFAFVEARNEGEQAALEKALHTAFSARRISGEWFRFDAFSPQDKAEFNRLSLQQIAYNLGPGIVWQKISVSMLDNHIARTVSDARGRRRDECAERRAKRKQAWAELGQYGTI